MSCVDRPRTLREGAPSRNDDGETTMTKQWLGVVAGCVLVFSAGGAMAAGCSGTISADEALKAENARYAAQTSGDFKAMEKLFGDDLLYTHSSARTDTKASYIELQRSKAVVYQKMRTSDVKVRTYGCVAIIKGAGHYQVAINGKSQPVELVFEAVWAMREGGPQFVSWESTPVAKH